MPTVEDKICVAHQNAVWITWNDNNSIRCIPNLDIFCGDRIEMLTEIMHSVSLK